MSRNAEPVELTFESLRRETDAAYLVVIEGEEHWIPKSQIGEWDAADRTFEIPEWLAYDKGLI